MTYQIDPTSGPKDMFGQSPSIVDVGPALFARPRPSQVNFCYAFIIVTFKLVNIGTHNWT